MEQYYYNANMIKDYRYLYSIVCTSNEGGNKYTDTKTTLIIFANTIPTNIKNTSELLIDYKFMNLRNNIIKPDIESYEFILPNFHKMNYNECNEIEKFLWLFSCKSIDEMKIVKLNNNTKEIVCELERLNMDDNAKFEYDHEIAHKKMMNTAVDDAMQEGIQVGIEQERVKIIKSLYYNGISLELISKSVNLSIEEVKTILEIE